MATIELTKENFEKTLEDNDIVLLDFWADWCRPCKMFGPIFEAASEKHPDIAFGKINTEHERELAASFQIRSIPMLMIFRGQIPVFAQPGALPAPALENLIEQARGLDMEQLRAEYERQLAEHTKNKA
jgi:thioredoxin